MKEKLLFVLSAAMLAGCSTLPASDQMARLPVVELGQTAPATPFILHIPAGRPVTAEAVVKGDIFSKADEKTLQVALAKDIYLYKDYASRDGKKWVKASNLISGNFDIRLPSTEHPSPGLISITLNNKTPQ